MEKELVCHILGIRELKDEQGIKAAYMKKLKTTNPEDDPEGFRKLRKAYEQALELLGSSEEGEEKEKTELDLWIDRIDAVYRDYRSRGDEEAWKELLSDSVCRNLDTSLDARDAVLNYLLSHFYLPKEIWQLLDEEFQLTDDYEELKERYPEDFLDYVRHYTQNDYFIDFGKFRLRDESVQITDVNVDEYIRAYIDMKGLCDRDEFDQAEEKLEELSAYGVWYPWEDVERMRLAEARGSMKEAAELADLLAAGCLETLSSCPEGAEPGGDVVYILPKAANVKWNEGDKETAFSWWRLVPDAYESKIGMIKYYLQSGETAEKAKDIALDIWEQDGSSQRVDEYVHQANALLLERYERELRELKSEEERSAVLLETAWCWYQNKEAEESIRILDDIVPHEEIYYSYHNLKGRVLAALGRNQEAVRELKIWLSLILETVDDGSEEAGKRLRRKGTAYLMLGFCLSREKEYDEAVEMLKHAEEELSDISERLSAMNTLAETYIDMEAYEKAVDTCDQILSRESQYYPAYVNRQEAYYQMQNGQGVVNDYYSAIEIYAGYYKPYLLALKVFFFCHQYEDAKGVLDRAKENQAEFSDEMKLYQVKVLRNLAESAEDREEAKQILREIKKSLDKNETDLEDLSELEYELALLYWDDDRLDDALTCLKAAIRKNPSRLQYFMVKGEILRQKGQFREALKAYEVAKEDYDEEASFYYGVGCCYQAAYEEEKALAYFLKAAERDGKYRDVNEKIADIYMDRYERGCNPEDFGNAIRYVNQEVENWEGCYTYVHRGLMYMEAMRLTEAIADFEKALTYVPDDWAAYNNMGYCYKHKKEFDAGIRMYEKSLEALQKTKDRRVLPYSNMADCYELKGDFGNAIECYKKDLEWYPDRIAFYQEIGDLYFYQGDYRSAIKFYETAGCKWKDKEYLLKIGDVYFVQGRNIKAKSMYKKALQVSAAGPDSYQRHTDYAYRLLSLFADYLGAITVLQKANQKLELGWQASDEDCARNELYQARAYYLLGRPEEAAGHAARAKELYLAEAHSEEDYLRYPAYRPLHLSRIGECYLYMGEAEKAWELFGQLENGYRCKHCRNIRCYEKYRNLGLYYLGLSRDRKKEALENYEKALEIRPYDLELKEMVKKLRKELGK